MADAGFAEAATDFGGAVRDLFGAKGATASAGSYTDAAAIAEQNAQLSKQATEITEAQLTRSIAKTTGKQIADVGGAGFKESGTALDLLRDSAQQGALTKALAAENGAIQENSYAAQAGFYTSMSAGAKSSATGQTIGGIVQGAGGVLNLAKGVKNLFSSSPTGAAPASAADAAATGATTAEEAAQLLSQGGNAGVVDAATDFGRAAASVGGDAATGAFVGGAATDWATGAAIEAGVTEAATGAVIEGSLPFGENAILAAASWIVCTELHRQGRMPTRIYRLAAPEFATYSERGKRGYYVWAIPSTRHLRAHPDSVYSCFLERLFNARAEYIANRKRGRPTTVAGAIVTHGLYFMCLWLSYFVPASVSRWENLYRDEDTH